MRIAHVVSTYPPYRGGQGNVAAEIAKRTAVRGHNVVVVTPEQVESEELRVKSDRNRQLSTINYQLSTPRSWLRVGNASWCPSIGRTLEELQPDVVHLHWPFIGGVAPVLAWRRHDARSPNYSPIRTNRRIEDDAFPRPETYPRKSLSLFRTKLRKDLVGRRLVVQYHMDLIGGGWRGALFAAYQRRALPQLLRTADRIVVSSLDYARHGALAPYVELLGDRLAEISLGVDITRFSPSFRGGARGGGMGGVEGGHEAVVSNGAMRQWNNDLSVLFVGGLDRAHAFKGVPVLLEAAARVPDVRLRIVGDGDLRTQYEQQARVLGISDRVEFLGSVADEELPDIYRSSDVLVLPSTSRSEAFGVVLLEAIASGIPVIASDLPGVRTIVLEGETGFLVPPGDAMALADRLSWCATHRSELHTMGTAARRRVEERYAWDRIIDRWSTLYDRISAADRTQAYS